MSSTLSEQGRTQADAWRACGDAVRRMLAARESGDAAEIAAITAAILYADARRAG